MGDQSSGSTSGGLARVMRVGGACAVVSTVVYVVCGVLHGPLSGRGGAAIIYQHVLDRPYWAAVNLGALLAVVGWLAAFIVVGYVTSTPARGGGVSGTTLAGRLATVTMTVGTAVGALQFLVDGYTLTDLAHRWSTTAPSRRAEIVAAGDLLQTLVREPVFVGEVIFLFGAPFAMVGLAIALHPTFPRWFGWTGFTIGAAIGITGITWFIDLHLIPELTMWVLLQPLQWLWLLILGVLLWRRSTTSPPAPREANSIETRQELDA